jgi:hypothetical protein
MRAAHGFFKVSIKEINYFLSLYFEKKIKNKCTKLSTNQTAYKKMVLRNKNGVMHGHACSIQSNLTKAPIFA